MNFLPFYLPSSELCSDHEQLIEGGTSWEMGGDANGKLLCVSVCVCMWHPLIACVSLSLTKSHLLSNCGKKRETRQGIMLERLALQKIWQQVSECYNQASFICLLLPATHEPSVYSMMLLSSSTKELVTHNSHLCRSWPTHVDVSEYSCLGKKNVILSSLV